MQGLYALPLLLMLLVPFAWFDGSDTGYDGTSTPAITVDQSGTVHSMDGGNGFPPPPPPNP